MRSSQVTEVPVLIVGAGPTGLCASLLLARHGVASLTVERHPGTSIYPRATGINIRSMEVLRALGLEDEVRAAAFSGVACVGRSSVLVDNEVELSPPFRSDSDELSPCEWTSCSQRELEPILASAVGATECSQLRFGTEMLRFEQEGCGVVAELLDRATGEVSRVRCRYLIAADGAKSGAREGLGIAMHGPGDLMQNVSIHFRADIRRHLKQAPNFIHFVSNDRVIGAFVPTDNNSRWMFAVLINEQSNGPWSVDHAANLVRTGAGVPDLDVQVDAAITWTMQADCAERWRDGAVFLAGDAAHRMTPAGGLGMNTGIQDVHNLCWKLASLLQDTAGPALLDTYESERMPVARYNVQRSVDLIAGAETDGRSPLEVDLGFVYGSAAVFPERPQPGARPGARAPHAWLSDGRERTSTLDLFGPHWTLITGPGGEARGAQLSQAQVDVRHHVIGPAVCDRYGIQHGGAVLVRPDGHVAWRVQSCDEGLRRGAADEFTKTSLGQPTRQSTF